MLAVSLLLLLLAMSDLALAGPFTFPSQPRRRYVTLTAQDGQPMLLTITQTRTPSPTTTVPTPTPPTIPGPSGPRRTGRPGELELRDETSSDPDTSSSSPSTAEAEAEDGDKSSGASKPQAHSLVQTAARAQTTPPPPKSDPEVAAALAQQGYSQVTYYTCLNRDATLAHCGWHVPVVKVSSAAASARRGLGRGGTAGAALAAALGVMGSLVLL